MKIKVHCPCETRFEFEVEPVNGRMPVPISCPECGADATELANAVIRSQLAASGQPAAAARPQVAQLVTPAPPPAAPAPPPPAARAKIHINMPAGATPSAPASPPPAAAPPASSGLKISRPHAPAPAATEAAAPAATADAPADAGQGFCAKHGNEPAVEKCRVCGKPLCPKCMEQFGYVCSGFCRNQAVGKRIFVPAFAGQKFVMDEKPGTKGRNIAIAVAAVVVVTASLFFYYIFAARDPKVVYSQAFAQRKAIDFRDPVGSVPSGFFKLVAANRLLSVKDRKVTLMEVQPEKELWSATVPGEGDTAGGGSFFGSSADPHVVVTSNDVWLAFSSQVARFDLQTGTRKDLSLPGTVESVTSADDAFLVVTQKPDKQESLTRIALADATMQSVDLAAPAAVTGKPATTARNITQPSRAGAAAAARGQGMRNALARGNGAGAGNTRRRGFAGGMVPDLPEMTGADDLSAMDAADMLGDSDTQPVARPRTATSPQAAAAARQAEMEMLASLMRNRDGSPYIFTGPNVVEFKTRVLEEITLTRQAMKKAPTTSVLDDKNLTASRGMDLAQEMANNAERERTGGKEIVDVSRYEITLHRLFAQGVADFTGEIIGPPNFIPLQTVDVVAAGTNLMVFDKNNKKLWEAKLTYPVANTFVHEQSGIPCLETKDALYFADKGILTRYDTQTGAVRWRLTSVGITEIQQDAQGRLYLDTTAAPPEGILFSQQINLRPGKAADKVIMKVDQEKGRPIWQQQMPGDQFHIILSGKFLYALRVWQEQDPLRFEEGPDTKFNLKLLSPAKGDIIWVYPLANKHLIKAEIQKNWILLHFQERVEVLKFFSL